MRRKFIIGGLFLCGFYLILQSDIIAWRPSHRCYIEGVVYDNATNALADTTVTADGHVRWSLLNLFFGTGPKTFHVETRTDSDGHFAVSCRPDRPFLQFKKDGYSEKRVSFLYSDGVPMVVSEGVSNGSPVPTDQRVKIFLYRGGQAAGVPGH